MRIAFIGFGEAAQAFRASLAEADPALEFACYDILFDSEGTDGPAKRAAAGVRAESSPSAAAEGADWIVSAVTASSSLEAARGVAGHLGDGQTFLDINSVSPARKQATSALIAARGANYVDMAVMAPVHPRGHRTPVLLAGGLPAGFTASLDRLGFAWEIVGPEIGSAAAIKLVRSVFVKGLEAITAEALLAARATGCVQRVAASLAGSFPGLGWPGFAAYEFERTLAHGVRRAAEMRECAEMLDGLGLHGDLARAIAAVQERLATSGETPETPRFRDLLDDIAAAVGR